MTFGDGCGIHGFTYPTIEGAIKEFIRQRSLTPSLREIPLTVYVYEVRR